MREIETTVAVLQKKGWRMEAVEHTDESGEPFRTIVRMAVDPKSTERSTL